MSSLQRAWQWVAEEERAVWFQYAGLALLILLPLLLPGYILTLDLVFTPSFPWPTEIANTYPLDILLWLLHMILPGDVIEKIILFMILLLSGVGMHRLIRQIKPGAEIAPDTWHHVAYFAGIFYMINPFTYSRFMAGQWLVLAGYALLPFFFWLLLKLLAMPTWRTAIKLALLAFAVVTLSLHHIGMLVALAVLVGAAGILKYRGEHQLRFTKHAGLGVLVTVILTSFWWVPAVVGQGTIGQAVADFNQADAAAFATGNGSLGAIGDVVRLQGFWADARQLYLLPQDILPGWGLVFLLLWIVVIIGAVKAWRNHRTLVSLAAGSIILGIVLAIVPLPFLGYREPHKFVNLIVLGYGILGAFGVAYMVRWATRRFRTAGGQVAMIVCLLLPLVITPIMFMGFAGQLSPHHYPREWYDMNERLSEKTLFLPWHQYMKYSFSGRIIASPADKFFDAPMISSDQPEFKNVSPTMPDEEKTAITNALKNEEDLSQVLKRHRIRHILLAKEDDYKKYGYLDTMREVRLMYEDAKFKLYDIGGTR
jgi:hypothetical protein